MTAIDFFNENGYYIVTSPGQQEEADKLVASGLLRKADPKWFEHGYKHEVYVHNSVDCKMKMPLSLFNVAYPPPDFFENEVVAVTMRSDWSAGRPSS